MRALWGAQTMNHSCQGGSQLVTTLAESSENSGSSGKSAFTAKLSMRWLRVSKAFAMLPESYLQELIKRVLIIPGPLGETS